jgi:nucleoid-associated protein YgaU
MSKKLFEYENYSTYLSKADMANLFNVEFDSTLGANTLTYNLNHTVSITSIENISNEYFTKYVVADGDTWPLISWKNYNTTLLWWIICKSNGITNPIQEPEAGTTLKILNSGVVSQILDGIRTA